jgi:hypothetical protein
MSSPTKEAKRLYEDAAQRRTSVEEWAAELADAEDETLSILVARLAIPEQHARRDAVRSVIDRRLSTRQIEAMERLERSANRLAWVGVVVAAIGVVATFAQGCA